MSFYTSNSNINLELEDVKRLIKRIQLACQKIDEKPLQKQISKLVILIQRIEKLILQNYPGNIWWERLPRIFRPDRRELVKRELISLLYFLEIAIESLIQTEPNLHFAERIRIEIERVVCKYEHPLFGFVINRFLDAQRSSSTSIKVLFGLISAVFIYGTITFTVMGSLSVYLLCYSNFSDTGKQIKTIKKEILSIQNQPNISPNNAKVSIKGAATVGGAIEPSLAQKQVKLINLKQLQDGDVRKNVEFIRQVVWVISAGTLGSIISILIRIEEFQGKKYLDPLVPFLTGLFKPIIGASFGILFFTLINSQLVSISGFSNSDKATGSKKEFLIFAVAFIVGFSERLARDAIGKAEEMMGSSQATFQSTQTKSLLKDGTDGLTLQQTIQENNLQLKQEETSNTSDISSEATKSKPNI